MKNKELIKYYNSYLIQNHESHQIKSWDDLEAKSLDQLEQILNYFSDLLFEIGISKKGEVTSEGIIIDNILGKINMTLIKLKDRA